MGGSSFGYTVGIELTERVSVTMVLSAPVIQSPRLRNLPPGGRMVFKNRIYPQETTYVR
jgi:hypothetical protein